MTKYKDLPHFDVDQGKVSLINISQAGGKEEMLLSIFSTKNKRRVNHAIYDGEIDNEKIEFKKQQSSQWFDYGKFHNLSEEDSNVIVMFFTHEKGAIEYVAGIRLGRLVEICCADEQCRKGGWDLDEIASAHERKKKFPSLQAKAPLDVRKFVKQYSHEFKFYYGEIREKMKATKTSKKVGTKDLTNLMSKMSM